jgi:membrane fusion protein (multidrug efflux system)
LPTLEVAVTTVQDAGTQDGLESDFRKSPAPGGEGRGKSPEQDAEGRAKVSEPGGEGLGKSSEPSGERRSKPAAQDQDAEKPADKGPPPDPRSWVRRHWLIAILIAVAAIAAIIGGVIYWLNARNYATTDDAFVDGRPASMSAQVAAAIVEVAVTDNQIVKAGQLLARLDDRDFRAAQDEAKAQIAQAEASMASADAQTVAQKSMVEQASLQVTEAEAALAFSKDQSQRAQTLLSQGSGTLQQAQQTHSDLVQKQAGVDAAAAALSQAKRQLAVFAAQREIAQAQRAQAEGQLAQAQANLSRTTIAAPFEGRVTQLTAAKGAYASPGQALMLVVPLDVWVTANYRETQLNGMRPGQSADLCIDAYNKCFPGHVDSIQAGSGTAFSLLPAENATGNYVKIVQRVPVKLVFDHRPDLELGPGMSVSPSVRIR